MSVKSTESGIYISNSLTSKEDVDQLMSGWGTSMAYIFVAALAKEESIIPIFAKVQRHEVLRKALELELNISIANWIYGQLVHYNDKNYFASMSVSSRGVVDPTEHVRSIMDNVDKTLLPQYMTIRAFAVDKDGFVESYSSSNGNYTYRRANRKLSKSK